MVFKKLALIINFLFFAALSFSQDNDRLYDIAKNIEVYTNIYKELNKNFVDEIDPNILMKKGIDAMTRSLDPYTRYFSESEAESFRISTEGKYSGIGSVMKMVDSVITIIDLYENGPSMKAGLKVGDQIIEVEGKSTSGKSSKEIVNIVRGAPGTPINFKVKSYGKDKAKDVTIVRDEINISNVPYSGLLDNDIAYIHLSTFTQNAGNNVRKALKKLKDSVELKGVILDLRGNGGGLLREAIAVTNVFVDANEELVYTKGKVEEKNKTYHTLKKAFDVEIPLVVMIDNRSASASEIVSGSIQDLDRGVLIGQKSFGKGLVQNIFPVGYNSKVKVTISKYYIPSGRCIQSKTYDDGKAVKIEKDKRSAFKTRNGREVFDVGGVEPDILIEEEKKSSFVTSLLRDYIIFKYVNKYLLKNETPKSVEDFSYANVEDFKAFLQEIHYDYKTTSEKTLEKLKESISEEELSDLLKADLKNIEDKIVQSKNSDFIKNKEVLVNLIGREIVKRKFFKRGEILYSLKNDKEIQKAIEVLKSPSQYNKILAK